MAKEKTYVVEILRYPESFVIKAKSKEEARAKAKDLVDYSVWESKVFLQ